MPDHLTPLDASFLRQEDATTPMHVGSVMIFDPPEGGFDYERLLNLVSSRIAYVPRYRQRIRRFPGGMVPPVWVDDEDFDVTYHVRRSALPRPGSAAQLEEFVARIQSRPLDRDRPLWELYLVEGVGQGRFAIVTKTHQALVDGVHAVDIGQVIVDPEVGRPLPVPDTWHAGKEPTDLELVVGGLVESIRNPANLIDHTRWIAHGAVAGAGRVCAKGASRVASAASAVTRGVGLTQAPGPWGAPVGAHRRFVMVETRLTAYQEVRNRLTRGRGTEAVTVHDVVLGVIAGAIRAWLLSRGQGVSTGETIRTMVPISVRDPLGDGRPGDGVVACLVDLPVGEPSPVMRVHQVGYALHQQTEQRSAMDARALSSLRGFAPPTLHSLGARLGSAVSGGSFNLVVTNVPGPQRRMYAGQAAMVASCPVLPLGGGQALTIGLTSYDGKVYFGINADRDAVPDIDVLGQCLEDAVAELSDDLEIAQ